MTDSDVSMMTGLMDRLDPFADWSLRDAARILGLAMISMYIMAFLVGDVLMDNLIVPGDEGRLADDIEADGTLFAYAVVGYLVLLAIDAVIALSLYVVFRPANKDQAALMAALRLVYVVISLANLLALVAQVTDTHAYGAIKLVAYLFFILHLIVLGYVAYKSGYVPRALGALVMIAAFCYIPAFYLGPFVPEDAVMIFALPIFIGEFSLGIWLLARSSRLDSIVEDLTARGHPTGSPATASRYN